MNSDVSAVLVSALVATINPTLIAAVAVMLLLEHPKRLMLGYLLGAYATSIAAGLAIVFSLRGSSLVRASTHVLSPGGEVAVGVIAVVVAFKLATGRDRVRKWRRRRKQGRASVRPPGKPWHVRWLEKGSAPVTFLLGAAMSFPGVVYVNALDHIAHLDPPTVPLLALIVFFCAMQQIVLEAALLASSFAPRWTQNAMVKFRTWLTGHGRQIATVGLSGIGLLLAVRGLFAIV